MIERADTERIVGAVVRDRDGGDLGVVRLVYADHDSGRPEWAVIEAVGGERFVPLFPATYADNEIVVPVAAAEVASSPAFDPDAGHLSGEDEAALYAHYRYTPDGMPFELDEGEAGPGTEDLPNDEPADVVHPAETIALETDIEASQGYLTEEQRNERAEARAAVTGRHRREAYDPADGEDEPVG